MVDVLAARYRALDVAAQLFEEGVGEALVGLAAVCAAVEASQGAVPASVHHVLPPGVGAAASRLAVHGDPVIAVELEQLCVGVDLMVAGVPVSRFGARRLAEGPGLRNLQVVHIIGYRRPLVGKIHNPVAVQLIIPLGKGIFVFGCVGHCGNIVGSRVIVNLRILICGHGGAHHELVPVRQVIAFDVIVFQFGLIRPADTGIDHIAGGHDVSGAGFVMVCRHRFFLPLGQFRDPGGCPALGGRAGDSIGIAVCGDGHGFRRSVLIPGDGHAHIFEILFVVRHIALCDRVHIRLRGIRPLQILRRCRQARGGRGVAHPGILRRVVAALILPGYPGFQAAVIFRLQGNHAVRPWHMDIDLLHGVRVGDPVAVAVRKGSGKAHWNIRHIIIVTDLRLTVRPQSEPIPIIIFRPDLIQAGQGGVVAEIHRAGGDGLAVCFNHGGKGVFLIDIRLAQIQLRRVVAVLLRCHSGCKFPVQIEGNLFAAGRQPVHRKAVLIDPGRGIEADGGTAQICLT